MESPTKLSIVSTCRFAMPNFERSSLICSFIYHQFEKKACLERRTYISIEKIAIQELCKVRHTILIESWNWERGPLMSYYALDYFTSLLCIKKIFSPSLLDVKNIILLFSEHGIFPTFFLHHCHLETAHLRILRCNQSFSIRRKMAK